MEKSFKEIETYSIKGNPSIWADGFYLASVIIKPLKNSYDTSFME
ncbi:hypothetical protein J43TS3_19910 [Ornithinibacillus bavariensis]|uniref:Uncharacterized protein n=1 Tax=Ornithinibacillus bavariensis TaxID=545502 RepID=A0A919XB11_9BACI|nr:hypothetical protein J43TS3_19910 [Ornithinibacillus bavariensis]